MKLITAILIILTTIVIFQGSAFSLTISPSTFEIETEPKVPQTFNINVYNDSKRKCNIIAYVMDYTFDKKGNKIFKPAGSLTNSIAKYITLSDTRFMLEPNTIKTVEMTVNIPPGIIGGNKAVSFFKAFLFIPQYLKNVNNVTVSTRLGATILQETKNILEIKSRIKSVDIFSLLPLKQLGIKIKVINEGNTHIHSSGVIAITGKDDTFFDSFPLSKKIIYPNQESILSGKLQISLEPGSYTALITYQFKDKNVLINKPFVIN